MTWRLTHSPIETVDTFLVNLSTIRLIPSSIECAG